MLAFNHILSGSIIGLLVPAPLVAPVAFATHFIFDMLPHAFGEEPPYSRFLRIQIRVDAVLSVAAIIFVSLLFPNKLFLVGLGAFFATVPDVLWLFWRRGGPKWFDRMLDFAHWIQWGERPYGWIFDAFYGLMMVITLHLLAS